MVVVVIREIPAEVTVKITIRIKVKATDTIRVKATGRTKVTDRNIKIRDRITVKITTINSRNIPAKEILTEVVEAKETHHTIIIIRTGEMAEERGEEEEGFKVDGIREAIIPTPITISVAVITEAEVDNTEASLHVFLVISETFNAGSYTDINVAMVIVM